MVTAVNLLNVDSAALAELEFALCCKIYELLLFFLLCLSLHELLTSLVCVLD